MMNERILINDGTTFGEWWQFYFKIGHRLVTEELPSCKIALSVPSRDYVAAFTALGASVASLSKIAPTTAHFKFLQSLDNGAALYYQKTGDRKPGKAILERTESGELWAIILKKSRVSVGSTSRSKILIREGNCKQFSKAENDTWTGDIFNRNHRTHGNEFLMNFFNDKTKYEDFIVNAFPSALCIGIKDTIIQEVEDKILTIGSNKGSIADFLQLNKPISKASILSQRIKTEHLLVQYSPAMIIYDTATAYLDHRNTVKHRGFHEIVVLDRADPNYQEGLICWNQEYKRIEGQYFRGLNLPYGVEVAISEGA